MSSCVTFAGATIGGTVMDRFGPRKVMMAGTTIMSLGFLLLSFVSLRVHGAVERVVHAFETRWAVYGALAVLPVPVVVHLVGYRIDVGVVSLAPVFDT